MRFGEILNEYRELAGLSINQLGRYADITPTYISRMQNTSNKLPSKKVLFKITSVLNVNEKKRNSDYVIKLFKSYAKDKGLTEKEFKELYLEFNNFIQEQVEMRNDEYAQVKELLYRNLIATNIKNVDSVDSIKYLNDPKVLNDLSNRPVFDLKWLLKQNDYSVFYGRHIFINNDETIFYNAIPKEDLKMISKIIDTYLTTKYSSKDDSRYYFDNLFTKFFGL